MSYSGRSPFNDVVRSVVLSAAMITPAALAACAQTPDPAHPDPNGPLAVTIPPPPATGAATGNVPDVSIADSGVPAPDDSVVRPRTPVGTPQQMPTRGFSGAPRARV